MAVRIGHASIDENGAAKNGIAGDQSKKEVCIRNWYLPSKGWVVLRCKDAEKRSKIAEAAEKACANDDIGYDQNQRDTLFNNVKSKGFDPSKTDKAVETDCSALVRVCIAYAYGSDIAGNIRTVSEPAMLVNTGRFEKLTDDMHCKSSDYLLRGDILCTPVSGHTVVVLDNGAKVSAAPVKTTADAKVGDVIQFTGSTHYTNANGASGKQCRPGKAKVTAIRKGSKHPYHLIKVSGGGSTVYGWVDASDIEGADKTVSEAAWTPAAGDIVNFTGDTHYTSANAVTGKSCGSGKAKITRIYRLGKSKHPYHLERVDRTGPHGWVDADTFTKA